MDSTFTDEARETLRADELEKLGPRYSPLVHWLAPITFGLLVAGCAAATLDHVHGAEWLAIPLTFLFANALEWNVHRTLLHRPNKLIPWLHKRHTLMHHRVFVEWDLEVHSRKDWGLVLMPPEAIILLVSFLTLPALGLSYLTTPNVARLFLITTTVYALSYESLHLSYHLPEDSFVGRRALIRWLRRQHSWHHHPTRMSLVNFNVSFPVWDRVRGTYAPPESPEGRGRQQPSAGPS